MAVEVQIPETLVQVEVLMEVLEAEEAISSLGHVQ